MLPKVFSEGFNCYFCALIKHKMVTLNDGMISLEPSCEWSSLRVLSGTDLMGHSSMDTAKQGDWWIPSMCGPMIYFPNSIYIPSNKAPRRGVVARRGLGAFLVL